MRNAVTCIIPVYNDPLSLPAAVESALSQEYCKKVIIVDDASTDDTLKVAKKLAKKMDRVEVFALPSNKGQGFARNVGAAMADTHYIVFLDADDRHIEGFYKMAVDTLESYPKASSFRGAIEYVGELTNESFEKNDDRLSQSMFLNPNNMVLRKHIFGQIGGFPVSNEFRGKYGGEDVAFNNILNSYFEGIIAEASTLRYTVRVGGAFYKYVSRTEWKDGQIVFKELDEDDEMFSKAFTEYVEERKYCLGQGLASIKAD